MSVDRQPPTPSSAALAACRRHLRAALAGLDRAGGPPEEAEVRARTSAELGAAERALDDLVAAAVHQLRTPVTAIKGQAQLMRAQADRGGLAKDQLAAGLARIDAGADALAEALDALAEEAERSLPEAGAADAPAPNGPVAGGR